MGSKTFHPNCVSSHRLIALDHISSVIPFHFFSFSSSAASAAKTTKELGHNLWEYPSLYSNDCCSFSMMINNVYTNIVVDDSIKVAVCIQHTTKAFGLFRNISNYSRLFACWIQKKAAAAAATTTTLIIIILLLLLSSVINDCPWL